MDTPLLVPGTVHNITVGKENAAQMRFLPCLTEQGYKLAAGKSC